MCEHLRNAVRLSGWQQAHRRHYVLLNIMCDSHSPRIPFSKHFPRSCTLIRCATSFGKAPLLVLEFLESNKTMRKQRIREKCKVQGTEDQGRKWLCCNTQDEDDDDTEGLEMVGTLWWSWRRKGWLGSTWAPGKGKGKGTLLRRYLAPLLAYFPLKICLVM